MEKMQHSFANKWKENDKSDPASVYQSDSLELKHDEKINRLHGHQNRCIVLSLLLLVVIGFFVFSLPNVTNYEPLSFQGIVGDTRFLAALGNTEKEKKKSSRIQRKRSFRRGNTPNFQSALARDAALRSRPQSSMHETHQTKGTPIYVMMVRMRVIAKTCS